MTGGRPCAVCMYYTRRERCHWPTLKEEFFKGMCQRVLVLVAFDVDALCACKILQYLFQCDHILYTIVPVSGREDFERAFVAHSEGIRHVILVNCGATDDIIEMLQPEDNITFFVCDSHRPVDVHNIYNQVQVKLLMRPDELHDVPQFDEVFSDDDEEPEEADDVCEEPEEADDDSGNDSDTSGPVRKKKRVDEQTLEKEREKRLWREARNKRIFEYTEFSGFGTSAALLMFEIAWKMSKDTNDLLWLAILGVTSQYANRQVERDKYIEDIGQLQSHVSRLNNRSEDDSENIISVNCLKITFESELQLTMYRHWSLFESLCHSDYTFCKFKMWSMKGKKRLHEFLADMGLPLVQCRQRFAAMDMSLKETVKDMISKQTEKYSIDEQKLFLPSFHVQFGFKNKFCAMDAVLACEAMLESVSANLTPSDNFLKAGDVLNRSKTECMEKALSQAKMQLQAIVHQVQTFIDMKHQVICAGPFLYAFVTEGTPDASFFSKPTCLCHLAQFTLDAYSTMSHNKRAQNLPLVLGAPQDADLGTMLVVGVPPASDTSRKNFFGKAFEQAAITSNTQMMQDNFDSNVIMLKMDDKSKFFDALISLLQ
ncbi:hypothetical protein NP493_12g04017 [Ridgeia piscesae]|uniref:SWIM-type domain-containing protein n=1 Tax=Ridgeia piscesae TaxID=27915 RepID=A0AAD9PEP2_RIDPI|nr:hypothetical protein NP493_12g04017 [Ridgeia piscesae]